MAQRTTLVILGGNGDLTSRLLLPGLAALLEAEPERSVRVYGVGRTNRSQRGWRREVRDGLRDLDRARRRRIVKASRYVRADASTPDGMTAVLGATAPRDHVVLYFALPPAITERACAQLVDRELPDTLSIALEKPFGTDATSAARLNAVLARVLPESRIHRVDHFLGHATVRDILGLRAANAPFAASWSAEHIERVDIVYDERLALEGRADYYDASGALVDMLQSHLLQVLALVAMEPPTTVDGDAVRDGMLEVLERTHVRRGGRGAASRRARYRAGSVDGHRVPAYTKSPGVRRSRGTETLAELDLRVDTPRWRGVPFTLRSGKALGVERKHVLVTFRAPTVPTGMTGADGPTTLTIGLSHGELGLALAVSGAVEPYRLSTVHLQGPPPQPRIDGYAEVLRGILDGDATLALSARSVEQCWRIVEPALRSWRRGSVPLETYRAGSDGPAGWRSVG